MPTRNRQLLHQRIGNLIGNTPLRQLTDLSSRGTGRVVAKGEYLNPTGSHYDRVMHRLLVDREQSGLIAPDRQVLLDVTSGNSGAALAWLARAFGYEATLIMPADMPAARRCQIESFGARIIESPAGEYVGGAIQELRTELRRERPGHLPYHLINHAADKSSVPASMGELAEEVLSDLSTIGMERVDYVVLALGNGSTLCMLPLLTTELKARIIGFEPFETPRLFVDRYGEEHFARQHGEDPRWLVNHGLLGTGPGNTSFGWPLLQEHLALVDDIVLVRESDWRLQLTVLADVEGIHCGRTTAAAYHIASLLFDEDPAANILLIAYDPAWKYYEL